MLRKINNFFKTQAQLFPKRGKVVKAAVAFAFTITFAFSIFYAINLFIKSKTHMLMSPFLEANKSVSSFIDSAKIPVLGYLQYERKIKLQADVIQKRRKHHYNTSVVFFRNYYALTICLMILYCCGAVLLFFMVNRGWANCPFTVKVVFITTSAIAVFFNLFANVFDQKKNFEANMLRFMNYSKAEMKIACQLTELSKRDYPVNDKTKEVDTLAYLRQLDTLTQKNSKIIDDYTEYIFSIDASKMKSMVEVYRQLIEMREQVNRIDSAGVRETR
jgi:hypothetical protein